MKNLWMAILAIAVLSSPRAHASTLMCKTHPTSIGAQFSISVQTDADQTQGSTYITLSGGRALYMMIVGNYPVSITREGPENAVFTNSDKGFELSVNYVRFNGAQTFNGNVTMEANGARVNEAVDCQ